MVLLEEHIQQLSYNMATLMQKLAQVEGDIANSSPTTDFRRLIGRLNSCDSELVKLRRRWHFQKSFIETLISLIGGDPNAFATACQGIDDQYFAHTYVPYAKINRQQGDCEVSARPCKYLHCGDMAVEAERKSQL